MAGDVYDILCSIGSGKCNKKTLIWNYMLAIRSDTLYIRPLMKCEHDMSIRGRYACHV